MAHLASRCACGRKMRFPKGATYGAEWTCWKCGRTYTLATQGEPSHYERSRRPRMSIAGVGSLSWGRIVKWCLGLFLLYLLLRSCR